MSNAAFESLETSPTEIPPNPDLVLVKPPFELPEEVMLASIARTALLTHNAVRIPFISYAALQIGNKKVTERFGSNTRNLTIVGSDTISIGEQEPIVIRSSPLANVLGYLIVAREILPPKAYMQLGVLGSHSTEESRGVTLVNQINKLIDDEDFSDASGKPLLTVRGAVGRRTYGMDDVLVTDLRLSNKYGKMRRLYMRGIVENYLVNGGPAPDLHETSSLEATRWAMRELAGDRRLGKEGYARFRQLNTFVTERVDSRTDQIIREHPLLSTVHPSRKTLRNTFAEVLEPSWQQRAPCRSYPWLFYMPTTTHERKSAREARQMQAKAICNTCSVKAECLTQGLTERHGIWGGLTEDERKLAD